MLSFSTTPFFLSSSLLFISSSAHFSLVSLFHPFLCLSSLLLCSALLSSSYPLLVFSSPSTLSLLFNSSLPSTFFYSLIFFVSPLLSSPLLSSPSFSPLLSPSHPCSWPVLSITSFSPLPLLFLFISSSSLFLSPMLHFQLSEPVLSEMPRLPERLVALKLFRQSREGNCFPVFYRELKRFKKCELLILSGFILMSFLCVGCIPSVLHFVCVRVGFGAQLLCVYLDEWCSRIWVGRDVCEGLVCVFGC